VILTSLRSKDGIPGTGFGFSALRWEELPDAAEVDGGFFCGKGQILWHVAVNTTYVHPINFLASRSRDMFDANKKAVDYLFPSLCQSEFDRFQIEDLACRILLELKNARVGNVGVQAWLYVTYRKEYENFTHLPGESIDALF
jgi:hypothetical protein